MNKIYILAVVLLVGIVGGALVFRNVGGAKPTTNEVTPTPTVIAISPSPSAAVTPETTKAMKTKQYSSPPAMSIDSTKTYTATITTDKGLMVVKLFAKDTPVAVNNFVFLSREGFYNNTIFHRIMKGFMIQGGDPLGNGTGGPGYRFADEPITHDYTRGTIAMANSGPNTNGSQFFIMHADYPLPKKYVIFGTIDPTDSASLAALDALANIPVTDNGTGENSKPVTPPVIQSVQIKEE